MNPVISQPLTPNARRASIAISAFRMLYLFVLFMMWVNIYHFRHSPQEIDIMMHRASPPYTDWIRLSTYIVVAFEIYAFICLVDWMRIARRNLYRLGVKGFSYSVSMAVWGWLIPLLNLYIPYIILREIRDKTHTAFTNENGESEYKKAPVAEAWFFHLAAFLIPLFFVLKTGFSIAAITNMDDSYNRTIRLVHQQYIAALIGDFCSLTAVFFTVSMIKKMAVEEGKLYLRVEKQYAPAEPPEQLRGIGD